MTPAESITTGNTALGIEILDTYVNCTLIDHDHNVIARASGSNLSQCYDNLCSSLGNRPERFGAIEICGTDVSRIQAIHESLTEKSIVGVGACSIQNPTSWQELLASRKANRCSTFSGSLASEGVALLDSQMVLKPGIPFAAPEHSDICALVASDIVKPYEMGKIFTSHGTYKVRVFDNCEEVFGCDGADIKATPEGYVSAWMKSEEDSCSKADQVDICYGSALLAAYYNWSNNSEDLREYLSTYVNIKKD